MITKLKISTSERFWKKVNRLPGNGCWEWTGCKRDGYGLFKLNGRLISATEFSYTEKFGSFDRSLDLCHKCDNPPCVRPSHLFPGAEVDNIRDSLKKGRWPTGKNHRFHIDKALIPHARGEDQGSSKLTKQQVVEMRFSYDRGGISQKALGERYGVSQVLVGKIVNLKLWKHIK